DLGGVAQDRHSVQPVRLQLCLLARLTLAVGEGDAAAEHLGELRAGRAAGDYDVVLDPQVPEHGPGDGDVWVTRPATRALAGVVDDLVSDPPRRGEQDPAVVTGADAQRQVEPLAGGGQQPLEPRRDLGPEPVGGAFLARFTRPVAHAALR